MPVVLLVASLSELSSTPQAGKALSPPALQAWALLTKSHETMSLSISEHATPLSKSNVCSKMSPENVPFTALRKKDGVL
eukprot:3219071-Amphidinium_carterae.1